MKRATNEPSMSAALGLSAGLIALVAWAMMAMEMLK